MISRKKIKSSRYVAALAITLLIFLLGYMVSSQINKNKVDKLNYFEEELRVNSLSSELLLQLVQQNLCSSINLSSYTEELTSYGRRVTYLESMYGFSSEEVIQLKSYYSLLAIRHWMLAKDLNDKCNANRSLVIYFYTNYGCTDCEDQGLVLTNLHRAYPFFNIYSLEYTLNNSAVNFLKEKYDVKTDRLPTLIINDEVYYGFQSRDALIKIMDLERKLEEDKAIHPSLYD